MFPGSLPHLVKLEYSMNEHMIPPNYERDRDLWIEAEIPCYYYTNADLRKNYGQYLKNTFGDDFDTSSSSYPETARGFHYAVIDQNKPSLADGISTDEWLDFWQGSRGTFNAPAEARYMKIRVRKRVGKALRNIQSVDNESVSDYYSRLGFEKSTKAIESFPEFTYSNTIFEAYGTKMTTMAISSLKTMAKYSDNSSANRTGRQIVRREMSSPWLRQALHSRGDPMRMYRNVRNFQEKLRMLCSTRSWTSCHHARGPHS